MARRRIAIALDPGRSGIFGGVVARGEVEVLIEDRDYWRERCREMEELLGWCRDDFVTLSDMADNEEYVRQMVNGRCGEVEEVLYKRHLEEQG